MAPAVSSPPAPRLSLLGEFSLRCGRDRVELRKPAQRLLTYLAVERYRPVRRSVLAERLWCDADPARASASLRSTLCRLPAPHRGSLVTATGTHVRLSPAVEVDLWSTHEAALALTRAVEDEAAAGCEADRALWERFERDLLPDWSEDWLLVEQESYRQLRLHALEVLSAALRIAGRYSEALLAALAAVHGEPLRETAHIRVVQAHLAEGNHAEALRQYQAYRRLLAAELGLAPSPAIRRLVAPLLGRPVDHAMRR